MRVNRSFLCLAAMLMGGLLGGCATTDGGIDPNKIKEMPVEAVINSAEQAAAAGNNERALALLDAAAKAYPASAQPWLKKARLYFNASNYPSAILAAEETLQRDAFSDEAKSIALVSSLRIAVNYVTDLRILNGLKGDVRPDAETLATRLRDTLNSSVLVPPPAAGRHGAGAGSIKPAPRRLPKRAAVGQAPAPAKATTPPPPSGSSNPFGSLK